MLALNVRIVLLAMCALLLLWAHGAEATIVKQCSSGFCITTTIKGVSSNTRPLGNIELKLFNGREDAAIVGGTFRYKLSPMVTLRSAQPKPDYITPNGVLVWRMPEILPGNNWVGKVQVELDAPVGASAINTASASMAGRLLVRNTHPFSLAMVKAATYPQK